MSKSRPGPMKMKEKTQAEARAERIARRAGATTSLSPPQEQQSRPSDNAREGIEDNNRKRGSSSPALLPERQKKRRPFRENVSPGADRSNSVRGRRGRDQRKELDVPPATSDHDVEEEQNENEQMEEGKAPPRKGPWRPKKSLEAAMNAVHLNESVITEAEETEDDGENPRLPVDQKMLLDFALKELQNDKKLREKFDAHRRWSLLQQPQDNIPPAREESPQPSTSAQALLAPVRRQPDILQDPNQDLNNVSGSSTGDNGKRGRGRPTKKEKLRGCDRRRDAPIIADAAAPVEAAVEGGLPEPDRDPVVPEAVEEVEEHAEIEQPAAKSAPPRRKSTGGRKKHRAEPTEESRRINAAKRKAFVSYEETRREREARENAETEAERSPSPIPMNMELELSYRKINGPPPLDLTSTKPAFAHAVNEHVAAKKFVVVGSEPKIYSKIVRFHDHGRDAGKVMTKDSVYNIRCYDKVVAAFPLLHDAYFKDPSLHEMEKYPGHLGIVRIEELPYDPLQKVLLWAQKEVMGYGDVNIGIELSAFDEETLESIVQFSKKYQMEGILPHVEYALDRHEELRLNPK